MRQTGHWETKNRLSPQSFQNLLNKAIDRLNVDQARREVEPFIKRPEVLSLWSHGFFRDIASRIQIV